jgi:hypothetical protein
MTQDYWAVCKEFSRLTTQRNTESGRCCRKTVDGIPQCCAALVDGTDSLQFTTSELDLICGADSARLQTICEQNGLLLVPCGPEWPNVFRGRVSNAQLLTKSLHDGLLSTVLENVSHPTRPVLSDDGGSVVGVASVHDCIAEYACSELRAAYVHFRDLWRSAVELTGIKPYYLFLNRFQQNKLLLGVG